MSDGVHLWATEGWLFASDAAPETRVPAETDRWIATPVPVEVRR